MFHRILIANRGEIACRIIKTAKKMGLETVVVYSEADQFSLAVQQADFAVCIGASKPQFSYLNIAAILEAAQTMQADAIHPGYGFLSENPQFAEACEQAKIVFIGPSAHAMRCMASKQLSKQQLRHTAVPLTPGYEGEDQSDKQLLKAAQAIGFPVLLKAALGGGGKGMRVVHQANEFALALDSARREAQAYFADSTLIIEKLIQPARHIEIQILMDTQGHGIHLYERDCSLQRRHQKIIEEAPAPHLSQAIRQKMGEAALSVAQSIGYCNAGTVEFLLDPEDRFYFMEMNTRLQVEHPVTEMITGMDLVEWQIRIAAGEALTLQQTDIQTQGHAIEYRIYAEDPIQQLPSSGTIDYLSEPIGEGIRLDTGIQVQSQITPYYDSMISKLIVYGDTREQAILRSQQALKNYHIHGVKTNIPFLSLLLQQPEILAGNTHTHFIEQSSWHLPEPDIQQALTVIASIDYLQNIPEDPLLQDTYGWQTGAQRYWVYHYQYQEQHYSVTVTPHGLTSWSLHWAHAEKITYSGHLQQHHLHLNNGRQQTHTPFVDDTLQCTLFTESGPITLTRLKQRPTQSAHSTTEKQLTAPMPATVVALLKHPGDRIKAGESILILEAMKMEHTIQAPQEGILKTIFYAVGAQVAEGALLVDLSPLEDTECLSQTT